MMHRNGLKGLLAAALFLTTALPALAQTQVNIISFAAGFVWSDLFGASGTEKTQKLLDFEKANDVSINIEFADEDVARQKVLLDLVNGTGNYDLVMLGSDGAVQTYSAAGYLEPLDAYLEPNKAIFDPAKIYAPFLEANTVDGKLWALPYYSFGAGAVYRKDIFDKYGITEFPKTTEGLEKALQTIKDGLAADGITDVYPLTMRGAPGEEPSLDLNGFVYAYAGYPAWFEGGAATPAEIKKTKAQPIFTGDFNNGDGALNQDPPLRALRRYGHPSPVRPALSGNPGSKPTTSAAPARGSTGCASRETQIGNPLHSSLLRRFHGGGFVLA